MKLSPLQMIIILVVLAGFVIGTYYATMDQLPDISDVKVIGNTTGSPTLTNNTLGTFYITDETNKTSNMSIIVRNNTKIFVENKDNKQIEANISAIKTGSRIDVYTVGDPTNTIPPQIRAEKIVVKRNKK